MSLNGIGSKSLAVAEGHGFRYPSRITETEMTLAHLMLITTEVAEAAEEVREGRIVKFGMELADVIIRTAALAHALGIELDDEVRLKMLENKSRPYKHGGKRA